MYVCTTTTNNNNNNNHHNQPTNHAATANALALTLASSRLTVIIRK